MTTYHNMKISKSVAASSSESVHITPASGSEIAIYFFMADSAAVHDNHAMLIWDEGGAQEEIIWIINDSNSVNHKFIIDSSKTDGARKLTLKVENNETSATIVSAWALVQEEG